MRNTTNLMCSGEFILSPRQIAHNLYTSIRRHNIAENVHCHSPLIYCTTWSPSFFKKQFFKSNRIFNEIECNTRAKCATRKLPTLKNALSHSHSLSRTLSLSHSLSRRGSLEHRSFIRRSLLHLTVVSFSTVKLKLLCTRVCVSPVLTLVRTDEIMDRFKLWISS